MIVFVCMCVWVCVWAKHERTLRGIQYEMRKQYVCYPD
jgi:hypothetical protein